MIQYAYEVQQMMLQAQYKAKQNQASGQGHSQSQAQPPAQPQTQSQNQPQTQFQAQPQAPTPVQTPSTQPQHQQLNAANLQQQQEELQKSRAASLAKNSNSSSKPPAAPTTSHAPVHFGAQSPRGQGVPQYFTKKNELTPDKLQPPASKKRKTGNAAGTPTQLTPASQASPPSKVASPEIQKSAAPVFKCQHANCKAPAFTARGQLEEHTREAHQPKEEHITDPVGYVLESLRVALNLDESGKSKAAESKAGNEGTPGNASKSLSSAPTPVAFKKEAATPTAKSGADLKVPPTGRASPASAKALAPSDPDTWANALVPRQWFTEVFRDVADLNRSVSTEFLTSWLDNTAFSPPGSPPNLTDDKSSPHKSDISATDNLNITIASTGEAKRSAVRDSAGDSQVHSAANENSNWLPGEWFDDILLSDAPALDMDGLIDLDWENTEEDTGFKKRDEMDASEEWLKAWVPERVAQKPIKREGTAGVAAIDRKR